MLLLLPAAWAVPAAAPKVETAYVQASLLRLRPAPSTETTTYSELPINTRLRVVAREGDWARVTTIEGADGWVKAEYLAPDRLTLEAADRAVAAAGTNDTRLVAWQRAAALAPTDARVLAGLAAAYRAVGREPDAQRVERGARASDAWSALFAASLAEATAVGEALDRAATAEEWRSAWHRALVVTRAMEEPLNTAHDGHGTFRPDPEPWLAARLPWAQLSLVAEGTWAVLELRPDAWTAGAARTPEPWDDDLVALVRRAYETATPSGWATWQVREWDYGGCSPFGNGGDLHLDLLLRTDALAGRDDVVAGIRAYVLRDVLQPDGEGEFPHCLSMGRPTPVEGLLAEGAAILARVKLTDEERRLVQARVDARFGR